MRARSAASSGEASDMTCPWSGYELEGSGGCTGGTYQKPVNRTKRKSFRVRLFPPSGDVTRFSEPLPFSEACMSSRRQFVGTTSAVLASAAVGPGRMQAQRAVPAQAGGDLPPAIKVLNS